MIVALVIVLPALALLSAGFIWRGGQDHVPLYRPDPIALANRLVAEAERNHDHDDEAV